MCENLHYELVYFKELHNEQEYYWPTLYRAGAAVVSTISSLIYDKLNRRNWSELKKATIIVKSGNRQKNPGGYTISKKAKSE